MSYKYLGSVLKIVNDFINTSIGLDSIVVDCTLGNGNDSVALLKRIGSSGRLYGFDIQEDAINATRDYIIKENLEDKNYKLYNSGHENIDKYINENVDFIIYNLGYLPGSDKSVTTTYTTTIESIKKGIKLLKGNGVMMIVVYHGHEEGKKEKIELEDFVNKLNQKEVNALKIEYKNQANNPPFLYIIEKNN